MTKLLTVGANGLPIEVDIPVEQGLASIDVNAVTSSNTETILIQSPVFAANSLSAGSVFRVRLSGFFTKTGTTATTTNLRIRFGPTGTTSDTQVALLALTSNAAASSNIAFGAEIIVTVRSVGSSGAVIASISLWNQGTTGISTTAVRVGPSGAAPTTVVLNTTVSTRLSVTAQTGATTSTVTLGQAFIEQVR